jgi:hypothetical protein
MSHRLVFRASSSLSGHMRELHGKEGSSVSLILEPIFTRSVKPPNSESKCPLGPLLIWWHSFVFYILQWLTARAINRSDQPYDT